MRNFAALLLLNSIAAVASVRCHACFAACTSPLNCDCIGGECQSRFCFTQKFPFPGNHVAVSKGCTTTNMLGQRDPVCIASGENGLDCVCSQHDFCNGPDDMARTRLVQPVQYDCCAQQGDNIGNCTGSCRGSFCLDDRITVEKGCEQGRSGVLKVLNIQQADVTSVCAQMFFDSTPELFFWNGCTCKGDECNHRITPQPFHQSTVQCHACTITGRLGDRDYYNGCNERSRCEGNLCFLQFRSRQYSQGQAVDSEGGHQLPFIESTYMSHFGCLNIEAKAMGLVRLGCRQEFADNQTLTYQQCICDSHLCNSPEFVTNESLVIKMTDNEFADDITTILPARRLNGVHVVDEQLLTVPSSAVSLTCFIVMLSCLTCFILS